MWFDSPNRCSMSSRRASRVLSEDTRDSHSALTYLWMVLGSPVRGSLNSGFASRHILTCSLLGSTGNCMSSAKTWIRINLLLEDSNFCLKGYLDEVYIAYTPKRIWNQNVVSILHVLIGWSFCIKIFSCNIATFQITLQKLINNSRGNQYHVSDYYPLEQNYSSQRCVHASALGLDLDWIWIASPPVWTQVDWVWTGCYGKIAVRCLFCNVLSKILNAHIAFYPKSRARPV